jgi:hypothetical protein
MDPTTACHLQGYNSEKCLFESSMFKSCTFRKNCDFRRTLVGMREQVDKKYQLLVEIHIWSMDLDPLMFKIL